MNNNPWNTIIRRLKSMRRRYNKRAPAVWRQRYLKASSHAWGILSAGEPSLQRFLRFERHVKKLHKMFVPVRYIPFSL